MHSTLYASSFAQRGMATIAANVVGAGNGPEGTLVIQEKTGSKVELPLGGRGFDINGDKAIGTNRDATSDFPIPVGSRFASANRRWISSNSSVIGGIDVDGDGIVNLHRSRIYFHGMSAGPSCSTTLAPYLRMWVAAVFDSDGGPS
jgi:hypothetical protein